MPGGETTPGAPGCPLKRAEGAEGGVTESVKEILGDQAEHLCDTPDKQSRGLSDQKWLSNYYPRKAFFKSPRK